MKTCQQTATEQFHAALVEMVWKSTPAGFDGEDSVTRYAVPAGALHRLVGAAQRAGVPAYLRAGPSDDAPSSDDRQAPADASSQVQP